MGEADAVRLAVAAAYRGATPPSDLAVFDEVAATPMVDRDLRRTWRVELVRWLGGRPLRHTVVLDAVSGGVVRRTVEDLSHLAGVRPRPTLNTGAETKALTILGCDPVEPPMGDFTTPAGVAEWTSSALAGWEHFAGPPAAAQFLAAAEAEGGDYGSIARVVDVPGRHRRVQLHFPVLDQVTTFKLRWGLSEARTATVTAPEPTSFPPYLDVTVTFYLDDHPHWPPLFAGTTIRLHVLTASATGTLDRVDLLPGAYLELADRPRLLRNGSVPDRYLAGTSFDLYQPVVNSGCELRFTGSTSQRSVTYTACRDGNPALCAELWCNPFVEVPDPTAEIQGMLAAGAYTTYPLCTVFLPPPSAEAEGPWTLTAAFADPDKEPRSLHFHVDNGLLTDVYFHQHYNTPLIAFNASQQLLEWVEAGQPFNLSVPLKADVEPAYDVPLQVWARARMPGVVPTGEPWVLLSDTVVDVVETYGPMVDLHDLVVEPYLVAVLGSNWSLLDLKVVLNHDHSVPESDYENNTFELLDFIPVAVESMDQLGPSTLVLWEDFSDTSYQLPWSAWGVVADVQASPSWSRLWVRYDWTANHDNPFLHWYDLDHTNAVSGVMIRYRRPFRVFGDPHPYLVAGAWWGVEGFGIPYYEIPPDLGGTEVNKHLLNQDKQWHTVVWRFGNDDPFGSWEGNPPLALPMGVVEPEAAGDPFTHLYLAPDTRCIYHLAQCVDAPRTELDFVAFWKREEPTSNWDASPVKMLIHRQDHGWVDLPGVLAPGVAQALAVEVQVTPWAQPLVQGQHLVVDRFDPGQPAVRMPVVTRLDPYMGHLVFTLGDWTPTEAGLVTFDVTLNVADSNRENNHRQFTVHVGACIPTLDLP